MAKKPSSTARAVAAGAPVSDSELDAMISMAAEDAARDRALTLVAPTAGNVTPAREDSAGAAPVAMEVEDDEEVAADGQHPADPRPEDVYLHEVDYEDEIVEDDQEDEQEEIAEGEGVDGEAAYEPIYDDAHRAVYEDSPADARLASMLVVLQDEADAARVAATAAESGAAAVEPDDAAYDETDAEHDAAIEARERLAAHFAIAGDQVAKHIVNRLELSTLMQELAAVSPSFDGKAVDMEGIENAAADFIAAVEANPDYSAVVEAARETFSTYVGLGQRVQRMLGGTSNAALLAGKLAGDEFSRAAVESVEDAMVMRRAVAELSKVLSDVVPFEPGKLKSRQDIVSVITVAAAHLTASKSMARSAASSIEGYQADLAAAVSALDRARDEHAREVERIHNTWAETVVYTSGARKWLIVTEDKRFMAVVGTPFENAEGKKVFTLAQVRWTNDASRALAFSSERKATAFLESMAWTAMNRTAMTNTQPTEINSEVVKDLVVIDGVKVLRCRVGRLAVIVD